MSWVGHKYIIPYNTNTMLVGRPQIHQEHNKYIPGPPTTTTATATYQSRSPNAPFCRENAEWGFEVHLPAAQWKPLKSLYFLLSPQPLAKSSLTSENKDRWWKAPSTNSRCSRFDNMAFIGWGPRVWVEMWWEAAVVEVLERMPREHLHNFMSWTWAGFLPVTFCFAPLLLSQSTALSSAPSTWY